MMNILILTAAMMTAPAESTGSELNKCVAGLNDIAKPIYTTIAPKLKADSDIKNLLKSEIRSMVMGGKLGRKEAKATAKAVGTCLKLKKDTL